jgi:two-component system phosphate regulon sensor histidine kinase PhoR
MVRRVSLFWRLFGLYAVCWLSSLALLGAVIVHRVEQTGAPPGADGVAEAAFQQELDDLRRLIWVAVAVAGMVALGLSFLLARRVARPVQELTRAAQRIAGGDYSHRVYAAGRDEIAALARAFNHMSERLAVQFTQLAQDRHQLRTILSGMVEGVVALDAEQRILFANDRAAALLDFPPASAVGKKLWEVVRQRALQEVVKKALAGPEPLRQEVSWNGPPARTLTVHAARLSGSPHAASPRGAVLVLHDTSELRRLERLRQEFVANVSHELKTPLSIIKVCVETLLDGAIDDKEYRGPFLERIAEQSDRLHALILDLISLGRIEAGVEAFEFVPVPLGPVVHACLERHRTRATGKDQTLSAVPPADGRDVVAWADEEALDNLVDNAVKYTPPDGTIWVRWRREGDQAVLEVEDNGIGIPAQDLPRIFERFYRVDKARSRELGGTGLGLSIVKHLVQAMHGSVTATSRLGHGTTFTVRLPLDPSA